MTELSPPRPPRRPRRYEYVGGMPNAYAPYYPMSERERIERFDRDIEATVSSAQGAFEGYLPPETDGATDFMENERRKRFLFARGRL
jgi:hypothetical protein